MRRLCDNYLCWPVFSEIRSTREGPYYDRLMVEEMLSWLNEEIPSRLLLLAIRRAVPRRSERSGENSALPDPHPHAHALIRTNPNASPDERLVIHSLSESAVIKLPSGLPNP